MNSEEQYLADSLRTIMDAKGITRSALARALGVTPEAIGHWLAGRRVPSGFLLVRLSEEFDVHPGWFFRRPGINLGVPRYD